MAKTKSKTSAALRAAAKAVCNISISDTGRGIPADKLPHIFDRFYQADDSYTKEQEGTGIGLALTKELVEAHHGKISVESEVGKGTTFSVLLPNGKEHLKSDEIVNKITSLEKEVDSLIPIAELEFSEGDLLPHQNQDVNDRKEDKPYLLIVDDNSDLRTYMIGYLTGEYYILEAVDGKEGLSNATERIPDLIISDVMMPKMDGFELCKKLKTDERTCHIPVILLTARASSESRIEGLETGADDFITKPFDPDELLVRIKNLIKQREKLKEEYINRFKLVEETDKNKILSMDDQFLLKAENVMELNISNSEFNVELFAQEMAMSRVQLHRKLRALLNQSASEFIRTIRLNRAANLLQNKSANVSEICYDVGFNNHAYFTSCFREKFGKTPSEYGNQNSVI